MKILEGLPLNFNDESKPTATKSEFISVSFVPVVLDSSNSTCPFAFHFQTWVSAQMQKITSKLMSFVSTHESKWGFHDFGNGRGADQFE